MSQFLAEPWAYAVIIGGGLGVPSLVVWVSLRLYPTKRGDSCTR